MNTKEKTGLKYTDGTPIYDGDTVIFWHTQEASRKLAPFERTVSWDDDSAAYVTHHEYGGGNYLADDVYNVNCRKITKKV